MRIKIKTHDFNLEATMDSGQLFGFTKSLEGIYEGNIGGARTSFFQKENELVVDGGISRHAVEIYFDLGRDLTPVYEILRADAKLLGIYEKLKGLRLVRQDPWEGLACFILSSNNNVKRIQHIWRNMNEHFARHRKKGTGGFPTAFEIASSHESILRKLGLGYRAPFLWASSKFIANNPECLRHIREAEYKEACERVIAFPGIGPKVADCVLLYAFQKYEAFPVDIWILRAIRKLYFNNRKVSERRVREFGQKRWKQNAGYVQQYIFHGIRTGIL